MKISRNRFSLKEYGQRVQGKAELALWAGNAHLRTRYTPSPNSGVVLLGRDRLDVEETKAQQERIESLRDEALKADQSPDDLDHELGFAMVRSDKPGDVVYELTRTQHQSGDPAGNFKLAKAEIDRYGEVYNSVAMRQESKRLEYVEVEGSVVTEYVFVEGESEAQRTLFMIPEEYDQRTFGDKALLFWNSLF